MSGTLRALVFNMVQGVSQGFEKNSVLLVWVTRQPPKVNRLICRLASRTRSITPFPRELRQRRPRPQKSLSKVSISNGLVRWLQRCGHFVLLSPTKVRAFVISTKWSSSKKPRRNNLGQGKATLWIRNRHDCEEHVRHGQRFGSFEWPVSPFTVQICTSTQPSLTRFRARCLFLPLRPRPRCEVSLQPKPVRGQCRGRNHRRTTRG